MIVFRNREIAYGTSMPETSINKYNDSSSGVAYIWPSRNFPLKTISWKTCFTKCPSHKKLRFCISALVTFHRFDRMFIQRNTSNCDWIAPTYVRNYPNEYLIRLVYLLILSWTIELGDSISFNVWLGKSQNQKNILSVCV